MPVPTFQDLMLPLLQRLSDGQIHTVRGIKDELADQLELGPDARAEMLPSKSQTRFHNRLLWAKTYLKESGLLEMVKRGHFRISPLGREVLATNPDYIDTNFLAQFPGYREFKSLPNDRPQSRDSKTGDHNAEDLTPDDAIDAAEAQIHRELSKELLSQIMELSPQFFEKLVLDVMLAMGYGGTDTSSLTDSGADEGIDGIINEDRLGLDLIYLQAKRWENPVGRPEIQKFVGALHGKRARKGVFLTTSTFTREASQYVATIDPKVVLVDGKKLTELMITFDVGVSTAKTVRIKRIDTDYFFED